LKLQQLANLVLIEAYAAHPYSNIVHAPLSHVLKARISRKLRENQRTYLD
jgi:hypothetical protein